MANEQSGLTSPSLSNEPGLNWGICGAAIHARKFMVEAIHRQGGRVVVIGASSRERAAAFATDFKIPQALEGYDAVLEHPEVEAVYLPLANHLHFKWALACARAGKHCLCEKPLVLSLCDARELREAFARAERRLMEAFMWRHHPHSAKILKMIREGEVGALRRFHATHGLLVEPRKGYRWGEQPGAGVFWDIGSYMVNGARFCFGAEPLAVSARSMPVHPGSRTDCSTVGWLDFGDDRLATFGCSNTSAYRQEFTLVGTRGSLQVTRPLTNLKGPTIFRLEVDGQSSERCFDPVNPYIEMVEHFTDAVRNPGRDLAPAEDGLEQAAAMEALAASAAQGGAPQSVPRSITI